MERGIRLTIAALIAVGAVARLAPLFDQNGRLLQQFPTEDAYLLLTTARNLALGHGIGASDGTLPANGVQPLATLLWSGCFWVVGATKKTGVLLVLVAELAIGAASALGLWQLTQRALAGTRRAGLVALLAAAAWWASPSAIPQAMNGLETGLYAGLVILVAFAFIAPGTEGAWPLGHQLRFGLALGLALLARSDALFLVLWACLVHVARPIEGRGRAPLRRLAEALLFGAVSVAIAAPWLAFNYVAFGSIVPISGRFAENLSRVPGVLVEYALLFVTLPTGVQSNALVVAASWLCCALGCAAALAAWWRADAARRALIALAAFFTVSLAAFYGLYSGASNSLERDLFPVSPFLAIALAWAVAEVGVRRLVGPAVLTGVVALAVAANVHLYATSDASAQFQAVRWVDANVPDDVWIGARQTGTLGFFHDRTVNLRRKPKRGAQVDYIVSTCAGKPPLAEHYDVLVYDPVLDLCVLKRKPSPPPNGDGSGEESPNAPE